MKRLGLIGGVSPEATVIYYRLLNDFARARLGPLHSANIALYALDYGVMIKHYDDRNWDAFKTEVANAAVSLAGAGADALVICSNTTHVAAEAAHEASGLPVIHMLDVLARALEARSVTRPLLLGTPVVMGEAHYREDLAKRFDGDVTVPTVDEQKVVGKIILDELVLGVVKDSSRERLLQIIDGHDCDGVILGCTELCMILAQEHLSFLVFDTTSLHARAAGAFAFEEQ